MSRGDGERVVWGMWGLVAIAAVFQLYNFSLVIASLTTIYNTYIESK